MDPAIALVLALSLIVPRLTVPDSPLRLQRSFCTSACTSSLTTKEYYYRSEFTHSKVYNIWPPLSHCAAPRPVKVIDHGTARKAAGDAGSGQGHSGGCLTQVVSDGPQTVHVAPTGTQTACQPTYTALTYTGIIPGVCHRCSIYKKGHGVFKKNPFR